NSGMAAQLAVYQARYGDWRELFHEIDRYDKITKADILRVAKSTFVPENRTVAILESTPPPAAESQEQSSGNGHAPPGATPSKQQSSRQSGPKQKGSQPAAKP